MRSRTDCLRAARSTDLIRSLGARCWHVPSPRPTRGIGSSRCPTLRVSYTATESGTMTLLAITSAAAVLLVRGSTWDDTDLAVDAPVPVPS
jgi:hypothetical protein